MILEKQYFINIFDRFNSFHSNLKFTYENENNNKINFLLIHSKQDLSIVNNHNVSISTDLYKKPTFSGRYLHYHSKHSISTKIGIVKSLLQKIFILSDVKFHKKNMKLLRKDVA